MNIFSDYAVYLKNNPNKYWFKRKLYGWGWTPARTPGWIVTFLYLIAVVITILLLERNYLSEVQGLALFVVVTITFIVVAWQTGEPPRWQWGLPPSDGNK